MAQVGNEPRSSRGDGRLVRRSREVDDRSFRAFLASASVPRVAWATPDGLELVGGGAAATVRADGPDRFESLHADATRLFDDVDATGPPAARPRLVGGFAFDADHRPDSPWEGFPAAQFFLPAIQLTRADDRTWLSVTEYGPDADPETVAERLDERATAMTDLPMMSPSGGRPGVVATQRTTTKAEWTAGVERAVERIRAGELRKVVLATALDADLESRHRPPRDARTLSANLSRMLSVPDPAHGRGRVLRAAAGATRQNDRLPGRNRSPRGVGRAR